MFVLEDALDVDEDESDGEEELEGGTGGGDGMLEQDGARRTASKTGFDLAGAVDEALPPETGVVKLSLPR